MRVVPSVDDLSSVWRLLVLRAGLVLALSVAALPWPAVSLAAIVVLVSTTIVIAALLDATLSGALQVRTAGGWALLPEALVGVCLGGAVLLYPLVSLGTIAVLLSVWVVVRGAMLVAVVRQAASDRTIRALTAGWALVSVLVPLMILVEWSDATIVYMLGMVLAYAFVWSGLELAVGFHLRSRAHELRTLRANTASWVLPGLAAQRLPAATVRNALVLCGVISSALYIATDIAGGLSYPGYRFTSQAISELMAIGAPSERLVDPLFLTYDALVIAFGLGVFRAGSKSHALRLTGGLLIGYGLVGLTGPTLFEMHQRGTSNGRSDLPHIVVTGVIALITLIAIGVTAFAFGRRFRLYSFATVLTMLVAGLISAPYGARLAAGEATPGFGIIERIDVYASLLWIAVFAVALLRHPAARATTAGRATSSATLIDGFVAPGLEEVRSELRRVPGDTETIQRVGRG
jgi:uncharacterized membrane protein HdeD (DUF308 family)